MTHRPGPDPEPRDRKADPPGRCGAWPRIGGRGGDTLVQRREATP